MTETARQLTRDERDLPGLTVLALLTRGPRHPYDIHRFVVETRKDFVLGAPAASTTPCRGCRRRTSSSRSARSRPGAAPSARCSR
ncbi:hypothetical protein [Microbacterium elymi]|uniref:Uncharacterized protein n=1 Tax=Microbacterium elymi TaxID=2909587 RepID=A0ABY5NHF5_9MICO|nr:hypothetical protein [Microbacterium elymi]UUT34618.1 hypothetical protein L2X98_29415 [Microbacterium elymi]